MLARIAAVGLLLCPVALLDRAWSQPPLTTIQDVIFKADGTRFNGIVRISWTTFEGGNQTFVAEHSRTVRIIDGNVYVQLVPTTDAVPSAAYTVKYNSDGRIQFTEYWAVPPSATPLRVRDVRTTDPPFPGGGSGGLGTIPESDVIGLVADLAARPVKGPGYAVSRTAVISASGAIEGASGNSTDCIRVDGTAGQCGTASVGFIDAETPGGVIDGANAVFTLAQPPNPPESLALHRNGALQKPGLDFTLAGNVVTFQTPSIPQPADVILAFYRLVSTGAPAPTFADSESPAGVVDGSNAVFTLAFSPSPALSLQLFRNGLLQRPGFDFTLSGSTITFLTGAVPVPGDVLLANYRR